MSKKSIGSKEWAKHLRKHGKRVANKAERRHYKNATKGAF